MPKWDKPQLNVDHNIVKESFGFFFDLFKIATS